MDDVDLGIDNKKQKTDQHEDNDDKKLSKKDRIEKLIGDRLNRTNKVMKEDMISKKKNNNIDDDDEGEDEEDNLSDLDEFDGEGSGDEEGEGEEGEEGEDLEECKYDQENIGEDDEEEEVVNINSSK